MLSRLAILLEASLELTTTGRDDKATVVGECGAHDHVRHVVFMAWGVENCVHFFGSVDDGSAHLDGLTLGLFLVRAIHDIGEPPGVTTLVLGLLLELLNRALVNDTHGVNEVTADGGLASIDVTNENETRWGAGLIDRHAALIRDDYDVLDGDDRLFLFLPLAVGLLGDLGGALGVLSLLSSGLGCLFILLLRLHAKGGILV
mmetsp:Transcript_20823/g.25483  ORF Transcript_20823/g.25483 Transcript_20823/m.25483 type:complete len:202 (+) Transcript_20823:1674-2279(+)